MGHALVSNMNIKRLKEHMKVAHLHVRQLLVFVQETIHCKFT